MKSSKNIPRPINLILVLFIFLFAGCLNKQSILEQPILIRTVDPASNVATLYTFDGSFLTSLSIQSEGNSNFLQPIWNPLKDESIISSFHDGLIRETNLDGHINYDHDMGFGKVIAHYAVSPSLKRLIYSYPDFSEPNRGMNLFLIEVGVPQLQVADDETGVQLTKGDFNNLHPSWSPDSQKVVFVSNRGKKISSEFSVYEMVLLTGEVIEIANDTLSYTRPSYSPDGNQILVIGCDDQSCGIYIIDLLNSTKLEIVRSNSKIKMAKWSPNGKQIAYVSQAGQQDQLVIINFSGVLISNRYFDSNIASIDW